MRLFFAFLAFSFSLFAEVEDSILPAMGKVHTFDFGNKVNRNQREFIQSAGKNWHRKLRVMTYNMLYNAEDAEAKLPEKHRWKQRKPRLYKYLDFSKADIIGSQELQVDQVVEVMEHFGDRYGYYGLKTRENEGRSDVNAIFYKKNRVELLETKTIPYADKHFQNGFTYSRFRDKIQGTEFVVLNTKLTWGDADRRLAEAEQLNQFTRKIPEKTAVIVLGDFNAFPFVAHGMNIFYDGYRIEETVAGTNLKDAKNISVFGHFGPHCTITNCSRTLAPFVGPELMGFNLDHVFVNDRVEVLTHGVDTAKVSQEYPSDHFPVVADLIFRSEKYDSMR